MTRLQKRYLAVRADLFPRWDKAGKWRVAVDRAGSVKRYGFCDIPRRRILVKDPDSLGEVELDTILIHEICHAMTSPGHGERWVCRTEQAADKALALGRADLSRRVREDARSHSAGEPITASSVYVIIREAVWAAPEHSYEQVTKVVASMWGMDRRELLLRYKRCREVFDAERSHSQARARALAEYHKRKG